MPVCAHACVVWSYASAACEWSRAEPLGSESTSLPAASAAAAAGAWGTSRPALGIPTGVCGGGGGGFQRQWPKEQIAQLVEMGFTSEQVPLPHPAPSICSQSASVETSTNDEQKWLLFQTFVNDMK